MIRRLLTIAVACLLCSCARDAPRARIDAAPEYHSSGKHNETTTKWDSWTVTVWTDAKAYRPGESIGITVLFASHVERPLPVVALRCVLVDLDHNIVRTADHDLRLLALHHPAFHGEAVIRGAFLDPNNQRSGQFVAPDGPYDLRLMLMVDSKVAAAFETGRISVGSARGH